MVGKPRKKAGETLVSAFSSGPAGTLISVLDFSGPYTWDAYYRCMDGTTKDFEDDCKVKWLTHWSSEPETTTKKIASGEFSKGSTLTSAALAMAEAEFGNGRRDAKKLTIVITDGRPLSIDETRDAAYSLRKVSRLMFVPVTAGAPIADIQDWATYPPAENVIIVEGFDELASKETANRILGDACPNLEDQDEQ